jgi:putative ABC transport system substrate-binding protein
VIDRRSFVLAAASILVSTRQTAQAKDLPEGARVGVLFASTAASWADSIKEFREGLRKRGWFEGSNLTLDIRYANGRYDQLDALAAGIVASRPDVIFAGSSPAIRAVTKATTTIPIVFETLGDVVSSGLVPNLGRPGSNVTGVSGFSPELTSKRLQFIHEIVPRATRIAVLANLGNPATPPVVHVTSEAAKRLQVQIDVHDVRDGTRLDGAFSRMRQQNAHALIVVSDPMLGGHRQRIIHHAARQALPAAYDSRVFVHAGGLLSYGNVWLERFAQAAGYVDQVLRGARPADLPIAQPTKFELAINLQTAKTLGLAIPPALLLRADEVIQ